jgi:glycosyltransferase involved in cell wall biosynthesis
VPGRLTTKTGGYGYDRRIVDGLRALGWDLQVRELDDSFPFPTTDALEQAEGALATIGAGTCVLIDGLAFGAMADVAGRHARRLRLVALVHHPLAWETGLDPEVAVQLFHQERRALASARRVIVTSRATAGRLPEYGIDRSRIAVVEPGTDSAPLTDVVDEGGATRLLMVAAVVPRKGHELLLQSLLPLVDRPWSLTCVGSTRRHPPTVARVQELMRAEGLGSRVVLTGELDDDALVEEYRRAQVFVLPTFCEGYGMAVAEALAHGLPVVATVTGAIADLVGDAAGLLVPPGDATALSGALAAMIGDSALRRRCREGAQRVRARLPRWDDSARRMADVLRDVMTDTGSQGQT